MGRLWQTLILAKWNEVFAWIPMESLVYEKRPQYYDALQNAQKKNDSGEFIEFALSVILDTINTQTKLQEQEKFTDMFAVKFVDKFIEKDVHRKILRMMVNQPTITTKTMAEKIGMTQRGVQKNIYSLKKAGLVERVGSATGGNWVVIIPKDSL